MHNNAQHPSIRFIFFLKRLRHQKPDPMRETKPEPKGKCEKRKMEHFWGFWCPMAQALARV